MIILTARLPKIKFPAQMAMATAAVSALLIFGLTEEPYESAMSSQQQAEDQRLLFLWNYGWEVEPLPLSSQTLLIPDPLDQHYEEYILLQTEQGFPSLHLYAGEEVQRYTYLITNYPSGEEGVQVNLLLHQGVIIGGEVLSPQVNGFLHGLDMPDPSFLGSER